MNFNQYLRPFLSVVVFTTLQVIVFRNMVLWDTGFCYIYLGSILLFGLEVDAIVVMIAAFFIGLVNDMFYNTPGMHAFLSVLIAYLRSISLKVFTPAGGYEGDTGITFNARGFAWYIRYLIPLIFIHHIGIFMLEYADLSMLHVVLVKALVSTLVTAIAVFMVQLTGFPESIRTRQ